MSNVSSVKNLNGEVFSAIQDASLTDFVNSNSSIWSEITGVSSTYAKQTDLEQVSGNLKGDIDYVSANAITSLDGYATTSEVNSTSSILSGAIDYVSANAGTTYTGVYPIVVNGDTISADSFDLTIGSGLAFENNTLYVSADSVPEGVMVESACEYNAVNEISGYNGSAIAQYGAEKQWLVHDDTLVHASNSAQYALGVNLSAVAQLLGVDETVLWSGTLTWGQTAALSDSVKNYDRIRFYIEETNRHRKATNELVLTDLSNANLREFALNMQDATTSYFGNYFTVYDINEVGDSLTSVSGRQWWYSPWTAAGINGSPDRGLILTRVIGIGRKQ